MNTPWWFYIWWSLRITHLLIVTGVAIQGFIGATSILSMTGSHFQNGIWIFVFGLIWIISSLAHVTIAIAIGSRSSKGSNIYGADHQATWQYIESCIISIAANSFLWVWFRNRTFDLASGLNYGAYPFATTLWLISCTIMFTFAMIDILLLAHSFRFSNPRITQSFSAGTEGYPNGPNYAGSLPQQQTQKISINLTKGVARSTRD